MFAERLKLDSVESKFVTTCDDHATTHAESKTYEEPASDSTTKVSLKLYISFFLKSLFVLFV